MSLALLYPPLFSSLMVDDESLASADFDGAERLGELLLGLSVETFSILVLLHDFESLRIDAYE